MAKLKRIANTAPLEFLRGLDGVAGTNGNNGIDGKDGKDGLDGKAGLRGSMGPAGPVGKDGIGLLGLTGPSGPIPAHQINNNELRFQNPDGTWGQWISFGQQQQSSGGGGSASVEQVNALELQILELEMQFTKLIDTEGLITYIGEADPGTATSSATWRIKRITDNGGDDLDIEWADGTADFSKVWDDRLTFTYS